MLILSVLAANCGWFHNSMTTSQRRGGAFFAFEDLQPHVFPGAAPPLWTLQDPEFPSDGGGWDMITKSKSFPSGLLALPLQQLANISLRLIRALFGDQIFLLFGDQI